MGLFDFDNPFERQVGGPFGPGGIFDMSGGRFQGQDFLGGDEGSFSPGSNKPSPGSETGRGGPLGLPPRDWWTGNPGDDINYAIDEAVKRRGEISDAAAESLIATATSTGKNIQMQINDLTNLFSMNRITDEEIARRDRVQAGRILGEEKDVLGQTSQAANLRGLSGGGAASSTVAQVRGAGIEARVESRDRNIEFQKKFNAELQLATEEVKAKLTAARAQLDTTVGLAQAQIELGREIDPQYIMDAILSAEAIEVGEKQFADILELSEKFAADQGVSIAEFLLGGFSNFLTSAGAQTAGTNVATLSNYGSVDLTKFI